MEIREAIIDDVENLYQLWKELMDQHRDHHSIFIVGEDTKELIVENIKTKLSQPDTKIFVSCQDGFITGMIFASFSHDLSAFLLHKKGYIAETIIREKYQRQGIGNQLFRHAEKWLREKGADHIELQVAEKNNIAQQFWLRQGFSVSTYHMIKN